MKLVEIDPEVPSACNASDMRKKTCLFGVVRHGIQDMHDAFAQIPIPAGAMGAVKQDNKWYWAINDGKREPSDNLP